MKKLTQVTTLALGIKRSSFQSLATTFWFIFQVRFQFLLSLQLLNYALSQAGTIATENSSL
jgi:hypothetical protein